jgi:hypothetical protein
MNFIEAVKLLELDKNIKLIRKSKDFKITSDNVGIFMVYKNAELFGASIEEVLADDWYVSEGINMNNYERKQFEREQLEMGIKKLLDNILLKIETIEVNISSDEHAKIIPYITDKLNDIKKVIMSNDDYYDEYFILLSIIQNNVSNMLNVKNTIFGERFEIEKKNLEEERKKLNENFKEQIKNMLDGSKITIAYQVGK